MSAARPRTCPRRSAIRLARRTSNPGQFDARSDGAPPSTADDGGRSMETRSVMRGGNLLSWAQEKASSKVPRADLDHRDPDYIRDLLPVTWLLASLYFRADVRGLDRIPADKAVLLVGNHSGGNVQPHTINCTLAF